MSTACVLSTLSGGKLGMHVECFDSRYSAVKRG